MGKGTREMWKLDRIWVAISHQIIDMIFPCCPGRVIPQQEFIQGQGNQSSSMLTNS